MAQMGKKKSSKLSKLKMPASGKHDGMAIGDEDPSSEDDGSGKDDYGDYADHDNPSEDAAEGDQDSEGSDGKDGEADSDSGPEDADESMGKGDLSGASDDELMAEIQKRGLMDQLEKMPHADSDQDQEDDQHMDMAPSPRKGGSSAGKI